MTKFYKFMYALFAPPFRLFLRPEIEGLEKLPEDGGYLICANHTAICDVFLLAVATKKQLCFMAKKELFKIPVLSQLITGLGAFPIDRGGTDVRSLKNAISMLENGDVVCVFPQGTRQAGKNPRDTEVKSGIGMLAWHTKASVIPAHIGGRENRVRLFRRNKIVFGDPIPYDSLGFERGGIKEYRQASTAVFEEICNLGDRVAAEASEAEK